MATVAEVDVAAALPGGGPEAVPAVHAAETPSAAGAEPVAARISRSEAEAVRLVGLARRATCRRLRLVPPRHAGPTRGTVVAAAAAARRRQARACRRVTHRALASVVQTEAGTHRNRRARKCQRSGLLPWMAGRLRSRPSRRPNQHRSHRWRCTSPTRLPSDRTPACPQPPPARRHPPCPSLPRRGTPQMTSRLLLLPCLARLRVLAPNRQAPPPRLWLLARRAEHACPRRARTHNRQAAAAGRSCHRWCGPHATGPGLAPRPARERRRARAAPSGRGTPTRRCCRTVCSAGSPTD